MKYKITRETLLAMQNGVKTKEMAVLKEMNKGVLDSRKLEEAYDKSNAVAATDIDVQKIHKAGMAPQVSEDAIQALLSGKKAKQIVSEGNAFLKKGDIGDILKEGVSIPVPSIGQNEVLSESRPVVVSDKETTKEIVYEIIGEILGLSNENLKDKEYIKKTLSEVYTFIKLKESLR